MRYTLATGEPIFTGFMRTRPSIDAVGDRLRHAVSAAVWMAGVCRHRGGRHLLSWSLRRLPVSGDAATIYYIGAALFLSCVAHPVARQAHRAHARNPQLGGRRDHAGRLPDHGDLVRSRRRLGSRASPGSLASISRQANCNCCRPAPISCCSRRWSRIPVRRRRRQSRACRTGRVTRATAWASAPATSRAPSAVNRSSVAHTGFIFSPSTEATRALARVVADRPRRSMRHLRGRRRARYAAAGAPLRDVSARAAPTSKASASARRSRRPWASAKAR